jgi:MFS superfamily sulfate permease-like transporter
MSGVLIFDTLPGLFLGIAISLLLLVYRASRPHIAVLGRVPGTADQWVDVERHPQDEPVPGVVVLRRAGADAPLVQVHRTIEDAIDAVAPGQVSRQD